MQFRGEVGIRSPGGTADGRAFPRAPRDDLHEILFGYDGARDRRGDREVEILRFQGDRQGGRRNEEKNGLI